MCRLPSTLAIPCASRLTDWLSEQLPAALAAALPVRRVTPVGGGCIHAAWRLDLQSGERLFAKSNSCSVLGILQAEADGLRALAQVADAAGPEEMPALPEPLALGEVDDQALLVLSWLDLTERSDPAAWSGFGAALARLHQRSRLLNRERGFGAEAANFIGSTPQPNGWKADWSRFFCDQRLRPQLALLQSRGLAPEGSEALLSRVADRLADHHPEPVLVHGDLWRGNAGLIEQGRGALFDPACYWGDREVDLAMARLFGGFPAAFFKGYSRTWPLPEDSASRQDLYNLYHLWNHVNLFEGGSGGAYHRQACAGVERLLGGGP